MPAKLKVFKIKRLKMKLYRKSIDEKKWNSKPKF